MMCERVKSILPCSLLFLPVLAGCSGARSTTLTVLDESLRPVRERFNADKERMRVVGLFSPV